MNSYKIVTTGDGSSSVISPIFEGELYHSERGAMGEAEHVFIRFLRDSDRVFEVGLGTGLNALLSMQSGLRLDYTAVELYPIDEKLGEKLSYSGDDLLSLHRAPWGVKVALTENFTLTKLLADITTLDVGLECYDTIFFDAFAPDTVPEQWTVAVFEKLYRSLATKGGQLLTYSAKGSVKQALRQAGFTVTRLVGALGKRHMLRALKYTP